MSGPHSPTATRQNHVASRPSPKRAVSRRLHVPARDGATSVTAPVPEPAEVGAPALPPLTGAQAASQETAAALAAKATATLAWAPTRSPAGATIHGASAVIPSHV
jgi:hypothetical protein